MQIHIYMVIWEKNLKTFPAPKLLSYPLWASPPPPVEILKLGFFPKTIAMKLAFFHIQTCTCYDDNDR